LEKPRQNRIDLCITELEVGGAERCLCELATGLAQRAWKVRVIVLGGRPSGSQAMLVGRLTANNIPLHFLNIRSCWQVPRALRKLIRLTKVDPPDVVQAFLFHANVLCPLAAKFAGIRHIVSGIRVVERDRPLRMKWLVLLQRLISEHVCVSEAVAAYCRKRGFDSQKITVIPNAINASRVTPPPNKPLPPGLPKGRRFMIWVGRIEPQKQPLGLIRLMAETLVDLPDYDLLVVGNGPLAPACRETAQRKGMGNRIHFLGWRADVDELLMACDLLLSSSAWEGMPNVVLEAMAAGKPVAAFSAEGIAEALGPNAGPQIREVSDWQGLGQLVRQLSGDTDLRERLGKANAQRVRETYSMNCMIDAYENLYQQILKSRE